MIHCDKCKTVNPPEQRYCLTCQRDLLPGTTFGIRLGVFIFCLIFAAFAAWVLWRISSGADMPDLGCFLTSPIWWGLMAIVLPIVGFVFLVKRTPMHERYLERGKRHVNLDRDQALADFNEALRLAPEKARLPILKERAKLLDTLGQTQAALKDKIAVAEDNGTHETSGNVAEMFGADRDTFVNQMRKQDREALVSSEAVTALGYCPRERTVVVLDAKSHCPVHPHASIQDIRLAVPDDVENIKSSIMEARKKANRKRLISWIVAIVGVILLCYILTNVIGT